MIEESNAEGKWCPFALQQVKEERTAEGQWRDTRITGVAANYSAKFTFVAVTEANRTESGDPLPNCMCLRQRCMAWRQGVGGWGFCSKLDDNRQRITT